MPSRPRRGLRLKSGARRVEEFFLWRFGTELHAWLIAEMAERGGKAKSVRLPAGSIGLRRVGPKLEITDQVAAFHWAKANCPAAIKQTESLLKTPLSENFEATGELPDGTTLVAERDDFYIR